MLILTRRVDESITIMPSTSPVVVTVLGIDGLRASIGIAADADTKILRTELLNRR